MLGLASATITVVLTLAAAWLIIRTNLPGRLLRSDGDVAAGVPGIVLSMAILLIYLRVPLPIYGTVTLLVIAYVTNYLPFGIRYAHAGLIMINRELGRRAPRRAAPDFG